MSGQDPGVDPGFDQWLDEPSGAGVPDGAAGRAADDPRFSAELELQRAIDDSLRRMYAPPPNEPALARIHAARRGMPRVGGTRWSRRHAARSLAVAAVLGLGVLGVWRIWNFLDPSPVRNRYSPQEWRSLETIYRDTVNAGFRPSWVCKNDKEFESTFRKQFGQPLGLAQTPPGVVALGLSYCNSISPRTIYLLARLGQADPDRKWSADPSAKGGEILVFIDRASAGTEPDLPARSALRLFRRKVGELALYELTPLDRPYLLDSFVEPPATRH